MTDQDNDEHGNEPQKLDRKLKVYQWSNSPSPCSGRTMVRKRRRHTAVCKFRAGLGAFKVCQLRLAPMARPRNGNNKVHFDE